MTWKADLGDARAGQTQSNADLSKDTNDLAQVVPNHIVVPA